MVGNGATITDYDSWWKDLIQEFFEGFLLLLASESLLFQLLMKSSLSTDLKS